MQSLLEAIAAAMRSMMAVEVLLLLLWAMTIVYMVLQDRSDRQTAAERHQEIMKALQPAGGMVQQVKIESKYGRLDVLREKSDAN